MDKKPGKSLLERILWIATMAVAFLLLIAIFSPLFSPAKMWIPAFFGLAYPYLAIVAVLCSVVLFFINYKKALVPLVVLLAGFGPFSHTFKFTSSTAAFSSQETDLKILSQNVQLFGVYDASGKNTRDSVLELIDIEDPDIACFQEFYNHDSVSNKAIHDFMSVGHFQDYFVTPYSRVGKNGYLGMILFSRFPIVDKGVIKNKSGSGKSVFAIWCDLAIEEDTVRVYNIHLQSIGFTSTEESLFAEDNNKKELENKSKATVRKLKAAFVRRAGQVDMLSAHIKKCKNPVFLAGDFNDTPVSHTYRHLSSDLNDAFLKSGTRGMGKTYNGPFPSFRIDYIFYPDGFESAEFKIMNYRYSDHFPISCRFRKTS